MHTFKEDLKGGFCLDYSTGAVGLNALNLKTNRT